MSQKAPGNLYLYENGLDDQIQMFDLILLEKLPDEFELKRYDIVVYEGENGQVVHRIVAIEEPNGEHPGERRFTMQGDAVEGPDRLPVAYARMRGVYRGARLPFAGSFVLFLQSPAGWLCILLMGFAVLISPVVERRFAKEKDRRLRVIGGGQEERAEQETDRTGVGK